MNNKVILTESERKQVNLFMGEINEISKIEIDLNKVFDLRRISEEELRKQHYDLSMIHSVCGFDSVLMKDREGNYMTENDQRVTPVSNVMDEIKRKYYLADWQIYYEDRGRDIQFCICTPNFPNAVKEVAEDLNQMGYSLSGNDVLKDRYGLEWNRMQFEPLYQVDESDEILNRGDLFHWTPSCYLQEILENGLQPRSGNGLFNYPDRIFMFMGDTPLKEIELLGNKLCQVSKDPNDNGEYALLRINSDGLREGYEIHYDPDCEYGVFTQQPIPPNLLSVYTRIIFKK